MVPSGRCILTLVVLLVTGGGWLAVALSEPKLPLSRSTTAWTCGFNDRLLTSQAASAVWVEAMFFLAVATLDWTCHGQPSKTESVVACNPFLSALAALLAGARAIIFFIVARTIRPGSLLTGVSILSGAALLVYPLLLAGVSILVHGCRRRLVTVSNSVLISVPLAKVRKPPAKRSTKPKFTVGLDSPPPETNGQASVVVVSGTAISVTTPEQAPKLRSVANGGSVELEPIEGDSWASPEAAQSRVTVGSPTGLRNREDAQSHFRDDPESGLQSSQRLAEQDCLDPDKIFAFDWPADRVGLLFGSECSLLNYTLLFMAAMAVALPALVRWVATWITVAVLLVAVCVEGCRDNRRRVLPGACGCPSSAYLTSRSEQVLKDQHCLQEYEFLLEVSRRRASGWNRKSRFRQLMSWVGALWSGWACLLAFVCGGTSLGLRFALWLGLLPCSFSHPMVPPVWSTTCWLEAAAILLTYLILRFRGTRRSVLLWRWFHSTPPVIHGSDLGDDPSRSYSASDNSGSDLDLDAGDYDDDYDDDHSYSIDTDRDDHSQSLTRESLQVETVPVLAPVPSDPATDTANGTDNATTMP